MRLKDACVCWTGAWRDGDPRQGEILVTDIRGVRRTTQGGRGPKDGFTSWMPFNFPMGEKIPPAQLIRRMFIEFNMLVVREKLDPQTAHNEFLKIDEYRRWIAPDMPGADTENGPREDEI